MRQVGCRLPRRLAIAVLSLAAMLLGPSAAAHALSFTDATGSPFANGGNGAIDITATDVNGDGHPDLLEPNNISHDLTVLRTDLAWTAGATRTLHVALTGRGLSVRPIRPTHSPYGCAPM